MINTNYWLEKQLQKQRFEKIKPYINGSILDFGGNYGELKKITDGDYLVANYDHSVFEGKKFDTIVSLAVFEHIKYEDLFTLLKAFFDNNLNEGGKLVFTTPTRMSHPLLLFLSQLGFLQKDNIKEHKHYLNKKKILELCNYSGFKMIYYKKFQLGMNQLAILK